MRKCKTAAAAALSLALTACGGGGGGSDNASAAPQAATGDFTASNYQDETDRALEPLLLGLAFGETLRAVRPYALRDARVGVAADAAAAPPMLQTGRFERRLLRALLTGGDRVQAQATADWGSAPCSGGGTLDLTFTYRDTNAINRGDRIDARSNGCIEDGQPIRGRLALVLDEYEESATAIGIEGRLLAYGFGSDALRIDGTARLALAANADVSAGAVALAYDGMSVTAAGEQFVWHHGYRYEFTETRETFTLDGYVPVRGRYYDIRQDQPFDMSASGALTDGSASLRDKDGDRVEIKAFSGSSTYTFFVAGSSAPAGPPVAGLPLGGMGEGAAR